MASPKSWDNHPWAPISGVENGVKGPNEGVQPMVTEMIIIHNSVIRGINAIYLQCVNIEKSPKDIPDFVEYCAVWSRFLHEHHDGEELDFFPDVEAAAGVPGLMAANVEQHLAFHDGLEQYMAYLENIKAGKAKYDGGKLKETIDSFMPAMYQHLVEEIGTLQGLKKYSSKVDWKKFWDEKVAEIMKKASSEPAVRTTLMPFCLSCHDSTFEDGAFPSWPPMPWIAKMLFRYYFNPQHKNWWRFGPIDPNGTPRELPFA